jgi:hypothetical protein
MHVQGYGKGGVNIGGMERDVQLDDFSSELKTVDSA